MLEKDETFTTNLEHEKEVRSLELWLVRTSVSNLSFSFLGSYPPRRKVIKKVGFFIKLTIQCIYRLGWFSATVTVLFPLPFSPLLL